LAEPRKILVLLPLLAALAAASPAAAQYTFDLGNPDESGPGTKVFGSAKDERGAPLIGAMVMISHTFVLVTDYTGRYRGNVPPNVAVDKAQVDCVKAGYRLVRVAKRPGPQAPKKSFQIDCLFHQGK
jgi:hypothetical protein